MLPALNIPAPVSSQCPIPLAPCSRSTARRDFSPYRLCNNSFPFPVPVPVPLPVPLPSLRFLPLPLPVVSHFLVPLPTLRSCSSPSSYLTTLRVLITLTFSMVIAIARTAPSTARCSEIRPVLIIIVVIDYLIPIQQSNTQEVAWLVLPAAWGSIVALRSLLPYQRKRSAMR